ncbi:uncharacterized protein G2W53_014038 [Senna tora]|uniref:Uncharacterized protein n=1 Tax=Senna tora TaxID=362788 RepID=A0A834U023_9FABA|nr:uncharacterized protein G2W53_014038 [Senna tora]
MQLRKHATRTIVKAYRSSFPPWPPTRRRNSSSRRGRATERSPRASKTEY